jgi:cysteine desulfurase
VVDAVALLGKEVFQIPAGVSAMVFSGHKIHAPKGIGLTFLRDGFKPKPLLTGGDQESSKRAGTENLSGILGLAKALELLQEELPAAVERMRFLTERLIQGMGSIVINGEEERVSNTVNLSFPGISGEELLMNLDLAGIAVSHGSACSSGALEPSRILINMGIPHVVARSSIRFSLSRNTTQEEIDHTIKVVSELRARLIAL